MLARHGETTPPCGVPASGWLNSPPSKTQQRATDLADLVLLKPQPRGKNALETLLFRFGPGASTCAKDATSKGDTAQASQRKACNAGPHPRGEHLTELVVEAV